MSLSYQANSSYLVPGHSDTAGNAGDVASMDEILASIRSIISESSDARLPPTNTVVPALLPITITKKLELSTQSAAHSVKRPLRTAHVDQSDEDVLSELLMPPSQQAAGAFPISIARAAAVQTMPSVLEQVQAQTSAAVVGLSDDAVVSPHDLRAPVVMPSAPQSASGVPALAASAQLLAQHPSVPAPEFISPPEAEMRAVADVFGALAAGLAAAPIEPLAPDEEIAESTPALDPNAALVPSDDALMPSPQAAAAAAVAEVAAVNAAGSNGLRQSPMTSDPTSAVVAAVPVDFIVPTATCLETVAASGMQPDALQLPVERDHIEATPSVVDGAASVSSVTDHLPIAAHSFEDTIAGMLRPLLREWLNANMPRMVEKALKEELVQTVGLVTSD